MTQNIIQYIKNKLIEKYNFNYENIDLTGIPLTNKLETVYNLYILKMAKKSQIFNNILNGTEVFTFYIQIEEDNLLCTLPNVQYTHFYNNKILFKLHPNIELYKLMNLYKEIFYAVSKVHTIKSMSGIILDLPKPTHNPEYLNKIYCALVKKYYKYTIDPSYNILDYNNTKLRIHSKELNKEEVENENVKFGTLKEVSDSEKLIRFYLEANGIYASNIKYKKDVCPSVALKEYLNIESNKIMPVFNLDLNDYDCIISRKYIKGYKKVHFDKLKNCVNPYELSNKLNIVYSNYKDMFLIKFNAEINKDLFLYWVLNESHYEYFKIN